MIHTCHKSYSWWFKGIIFRELYSQKKDTAFVRLEGGCQGCSSSSATLRQGVEVEIKKLVPSIAEVVDITDHSAGVTPYYS